MLNKKCIICNRIESKIIFKYLHKLLDIEVLDKDITKEDINIIGREICLLINKIDKDYRFFFCGKGAKSILAGFYYIIINHKNIRITQREISEVLNVSEVTVRNSVYRLMNLRKKLEYVPYYYPNYFDRRMCHYFE